MSKSNVLNLSISWNEKMDHQHGKTPMILSLVWVIFAKVINMCNSHVRTGDFDTCCLSVSHSVSWKFPQVSCAPAGSGARYHLLSPPSPDAKLGWAPWVQFFANVTELLLWLLQHCAAETLLRLPQAPQAGQIRPYLKPQWNSKAWGGGFSQDFFLLVKEQCLSFLL